MSVWSEERTNQIRELWTQGKTATEIGQIMGITKNSAAGRLHRIGLMGVIRERGYRNRNPKERKPTNQGRSWDEKVFESYADRKARMSREQTA